MVTFKDVLIKDPWIESSRNQQNQLPKIEAKKNHALPDDRDESNRIEDDLPDIDEVEIPDCEKFENVYHIDKMSVPLKSDYFRNKVKLHAIGWS